MARKFLFLLTLLLICQSGISQRRRNTFFASSELGFLAGGSYYIGDLTQFNHFRNTKLAGQIMYRFNFHSRTTFRANLTFAQVEAWDSDNKSELLKNRNLSFHSKIWELAAGIEFNYFHFSFKDERYRGTAYLLAEIGFFKMNPKTNYQGNEYELQPIGTEGQGSSLSTKGNYSLTQICMPLGIGAKLAIGDRVTFNTEFGARKTFTDYIDDVGNQNFTDPTELAEQNGPLAAALSNRSLDQNRFGKRATSASSDWYFFFGMGFSIVLGKNPKCTFGL